MGDSLSCDSLCLLPVSTSYTKKSKLVCTVSLNELGQPSDSLESRGPSSQPFPVSECPTDGPEL